MFSRKPLTALVVAMALAALHATPCYAKTFQQRHPRRAQVNEREKNQNRRINQGLRSGKLTQAQASELKKEEKGIKAQERAEVKANGGSLTRGEQKQINQELNSESAKIHQEKLGTNQ